MAFQGRRDERLPVRRPWKAIVRFAATGISPLAVIAFAGVMIKATGRARDVAEHARTTEILKSCQLTGGLGVFDAR